MTPQEITTQEQRIAKAKELHDIKASIHATLDKLNDGDPNNPFTGNWRESRQVKALCFDFTRSRGHGQPTSLILDDLHIEANQLREFIVKTLHNRLALVQQEIDKI